MKWVTVGLLVVAAVLAGLLFLRGEGLQVGAGEPQYGTALDNPKPLPDIALLNTEGQSQSLRDSQGKMRLVFYGFVRCPDVCPATMNVLSRIYSELSPEQQQKLSVQMISVDPEHDRPEVLREYLNLFDGQFVGLTGEVADIDQAAQEMFVGIARPSLTAASSMTDHSEHMMDEDGPTSPTMSAEAEAQAEAEDVVPESALEAAMIHGDQVSVVDTEGNFVRVYGNQAILSGQLTDDIPALLGAYGP